MSMKKLAALFLFMLFSCGAVAQSTNIAGDYYTIEPDYRFCPTVACGGWWLTKVNQYTVAADESVLDASVVPIVPNPIYVAAIDYRALGLSDREIAEFKQLIVAGRAFIRGVLKPYPSPWLRYLRQLAATETLVAANDNAAVGPYLKVSDNGIVCVTSPCPSYDVELLNSTFRTMAHELNLERADLTDEQTELAWRKVGGRGLILTGVGYEAHAPTGTGLGIAATKVFFVFPGPGY